MDCEVAIIGGGPAGTSLAVALATRGIDVVVLERSPVPRAKCCAGGLTVAAWRLLPLEADSIIEHSFRTLRVSSLDGGSVVWTEAEPFMYTVDRARLDSALWDEAARRGARVFDSCEVLHIEETPGCVLVSSSSLDVRCRIAVGADGATGLVSHSLFPSRRRHVAVGVVMECERPAGTVPEGGLPVVDLVIGLPDGCYGWVFPKRDVISVGIECHRRLVEREAALSRVRSFAGMAEWRVVYRGAHPIPTARGGSAHFARGRILLVGDAAGLCDPLTGEGIRNALLSAKLAADAISEALGREDSDLRGYDAAIQRTILPELRAAMMLLHLVFRLERTAFAVLRHQERARRTCTRLLRGEVTYAPLLQAVAQLGGE